MSPFTFAQHSPHKGGVGGAVNAPYKPYQEQLPWQA
jgi:hypothetical protein